MACLNEKSCPYRLIPACHQRCSATQARMPSARCPFSRPYAYAQDLRGRICGHLERGVGELEGNKEDSLPLCVFLYAVGAVKAGTEMSRLIASGARGRGNMESRVVNRCVEVDRGGSKWSMLKSLYVAHAYLWRINNKWRVRLEKSEKHVKI